MDNKDQKTFTDLFSSSKEESEIKTQTFSDILNNSIDVKESEDSVTFDSLFDQIGSNEEKIEKTNILSKDNVTNNEEDNPLNDKAVQENNEIIENESLSNEPPIETNPLFDEISTPETLIEENPFIQENPISNNETTNDDIESNINPFMDTNEPIQESNKEVETETITQEPIVETNPFFEETPTLETPTEENPKKQELENITPKSTSPFFEEEKKSDENPFFQNQLNLVENKVPDNPNGTIDASKSKHYNVKVVKNKEPLIKLVLGVLSYALFIWLLLIGITLLVYVLDIKIRAAKGDYSSPTFNAYVVLTGSMLPEIEVYDVVVTKKIDAKKLKEGDVITFASADTRFLNTIITHRIIKKNPPSDTEGYTFQTQGDNNNVADSALVPENRIFGKVILKIPKLGYLQEFLASRGGWIIVILIPCLTVISYDTVKLIKGLKKKKYKNIKVQK